MEGERFRYVYSQRLAKTMLFVFTHDPALSVIHRHSTNYSEIKYKLF